MGFAPIKSLIEHAVSMDAAENFHLYWFADNTGGHYMHNLCRSWRDALDNFTYQAIEAKAETWENQLQAIRQILLELDNVQIYIAGSATFLECANEVFAGVGRARYTQVVG